MKVLVACEFSGIVRDAFSAADTLGETMISKAWKRYQERQEGAE